MATINVLHVASLLNQKTLPRIQRVPC